MFSRFPLVITIRKVILFLSALILQGCVTSGGAEFNANAPTNEALLIEAGNHSALTEYYKEQLGMTLPLIQQDELRLKLSQNYMRMADPDSALFYIEPTIAGNRGNADTYLLQSRALLAIGKTGDALGSIDRAMQLSPENPHIHNQTGLVYIRQGQYIQARRAFNKARQYWLDDVTVKNNLALLDILEGQYETAVTRLMPLYTSGQADDKVIANLIVALVRARRYNEFKSVYSGARTEEEYVTVYQLLSTMEPITLLEGDG